MKYHMVLPFTLAIIKNQKGEILVGRHPNSPRKPLPGFWDLPGGKLEYGEDPQEGIIREISEELSVKTTAVKLLGVFHNCWIGDPKPIQNEIPSLAICYEVQIQGNIIATEQEDVQYMPLSTIKDLPLTPWARYFLFNN